MQKYEIIIRRSLSSTNDYAKQLVEAGREKAIVVALTQTGGRGRGGRRWYSPRGGLWFSVLFRPAKDMGMFNVLASLAVCRALRKMGIKAEIKWPNDVLVNGRKVCGILSESSFSGDRLEYVIIGMGVNCNFPLKTLPAPLRKSATTIMEAKGVKVSLPGLLSSIVLEFWSLYSVFRREGFWPIRREWKRKAFRRSVLLAANGKKRTVRQIDLTEKGCLICADKNGRKMEIAG